MDGDVGSPSHREFQNIGVAANSSLKGGAALENEYLRLLGFVQKIRYSEIGLELAENSGRM